MSPYMPLHVYVGRSSQHSIPKYAALKSPMLNLGGGAEESR
jgi:hypothetical protein